ncbi:hypothetical protein EJ07DRAFT_169102 [Lizonia empirigonia]|nr:hypothetical protein EJ07DRAFT_169102 [Lizonia empirigonia]
MSPTFHTFVISLTCAALLTARGSVPSFTASVAPAAETAVQLTDKVVAELQDNPDVAKYASLFEFDDANSTAAGHAGRARRALHCKTMPSDALYPSQLVWAVTDLLLGGALKPIVPIGSPCYPKSEYNNYDAESYEDNGALMNPLYYGMTCQIPAFGNAANGTCTQGGYSVYSVEIKNVAQIQLAVNFARSLNLRLVVRNTGHDYNGRSVGKGALSIRTHGLKQIQYIERYESSTYSGLVFKVGAGVQGFELLQAAEKYGVSAVAGIYPWAMLGGGGGTFGIITSAVVKVHPKIPVTTSTWTILTSETLAPGNYMWAMTPFFATNKTIEEYEALVAPLYQKAAELNITLAANKTRYDSLYPAYEATFATYNYYVGGAGAVPGSRLLPTENWADEETRDQTFATIQNVVEKAMMLGLYHQHPADEQDTGVNSVNPAFRNLQAQLVVVNSVADMTAAGWKASDDTLNEIMAPLRDVSPAGGAYGNEANIGEPDWQQAFWGKNYLRLLELKKKYDPTELFYVHHGVGSEGWVVEDNGIVGVQSTDGPLCRV